MQLVLPVAQAQGCTLLCSSCAAHLFVMRRALSQALLSGSAPLYGREGGVQGPPRRRQLHTTHALRAPYFRHSPRWIILRGKRLTSLDAMSRDQALSLLDLKSQFTLQDLRKAFLAVRSLPSCGLLLTVELESEAAASGFKQGGRSDAAVQRSRRGVRAPLCGSPF